MKLKKFSLLIGTQIFKSFSEEARVRIIQLLLEAKDLTISDLVLILDFTQTKTSRHVAYLKNTGLVKSKKLDHSLEKLYKHYQNSEIVAKASKGLKKAMKGLDMSEIAEEDRLQERGW